MNRARGFPLIPPAREDPERHAGGSSVPIRGDEDLYRKYVGGAGGINWEKPAPAWAQSDLAAPTIPPSAAELEARQ